MQSSVFFARARGFTLLELVMVILILGLLSATAVPKFMSLGSGAKASVLKTIAGTLKSQADMVSLAAKAQGVNGVPANLTIGSKTVVTYQGLPRETWNDTWRHLLDINARDLTGSGVLSDGTAVCDAQGADFCSARLRRDGGYGTYFYYDGQSIDDNCYARYILRYDSGGRAGGVLEYVAEAVTTDASGNDTC